MSAIRIVLPMSPGLLAVNRKAAIHHIEGNARIGTASSYQSACDEAELHIRSAVNRARWKTRSTEVDIRIESHWPTRRGDWDAVGKSCSDLLAKGGVYTDDKHVREGSLRRFWRSDNPRIEITVTDAEETE